MEEASRDFAACLAKLDFRAPRLPLYLNATARPETDAGVLRVAMGAQLTSPVRWAELILNLKAAGWTPGWRWGPKTSSRAWSRRSCPRNPREFFTTWENGRV